MECSIRFNFTRIAWAKAQRTGKIVVRDDRHRTILTGRWNNYGFDWAEIQRFYDQGHSYGRCLEHFKFSPGAWHKAVLRGDVKPRPRKWPVEKVLSVSRSRTTVKRALLKAGLLQNRCDECGIDEWRGRPIAIQIDHCNGVCDDHRLENLRMLCPNCHSQTETFAARNMKRKKSIPSSLVGRAPDSESGGPSFESTLGSTIGPIV